MRPDVKILVPSMAGRRKAEALMDDNPHLRDVARTAQRMRALALEPANRITAREAGAARWMVLQVMTGREMAVDNLLSDADVETWLPVRAGWKTYRRGQPVSMPPRAVMPGYLMVRCAASGEAMAALSRVEHVLGAIGGWDCPLSVSDGSVERFRMILDAPEEARPEPDEWVCDGARCRVTGGPFAGFEGFLKPFHRHASGRVKMRKGPNVMVVLPVAGQEIEIQMPLAFLAEI